MYRPPLFFNDTATTEIYTLSLHDALPIPIVFLTMDYEDRCVPIGHKLVGTVVVSTLCVWREVLFPKGVFVLPIREPCLFCVGVHAFKVKSSIVGDESLEAFLMVTC